MLNKYGVDIDRADERAREKADQVVRDSYPVDERWADEANERWLVTYAREYRLMTEPCATLAHPSHQAQRES